MSNKPNTTKTRSERPFAALNRDRWAHYLENPSSQVVLLSPCGRATQRRLLTDVAKVMDCLVSNMCLRTRKVGFVAKNGFFLLTWQTIADKCSLPLWRVRQCAQRIIDNGWLESTQPREKSLGTWVCLASIKRVTFRYITEFGLKDAFFAAHIAAKKSLVSLSQRYQKPVKYLLTPITLLAKFRRSQQPQAITPPPN
jgi:hypothetical protein